MITPAQLSTELASQGLCVTQRRLADWRDLGLLPQLVRGPGRGRGPGAIYYWEDASVVAQAAALHDLLKVHTRTDPAFVDLWALGYEVPQDRVHQEWLERLVRLRESLQQKADKYERSGGIAAVGKSTASYVAGQFGVNRSAVIGAVQEVAAIIAGEAADFDPQDAAEVVKDLLSCKLPEFGLPAEAISIMTDSAIEAEYLHGIDLFQRQSVAAHEQLLRICTDHEFRTARDIWVRLLSWANSGFPEWFSTPRLGNKISRQIELGAAFGRIAIPIIIDLLRRNHGPELTNFLDQLETASSRELLSIALGLLQGRQIPAEKSDQFGELILAVITLQKNLANGPVPKGATS